LAAHSTARDFAYDRSLFPCVFLSSHTDADTWGPRSFRSVTGTSGLPVVKRSSGSRRLSVARRRSSSTSHSSSREDEWDGFIDVSCSENLINKFETEELLWGAINTNAEEELEHDDEKHDVDGDDEIVHATETGGDDAARTNSFSHNRPSLSRAGSYRRTTHRRCVSTSMLHDWIGRPRMDLAIRRQSSIPHQGPTSSFSRNVDRFLKEEILQARARGGHDSTTMIPLNVRLAQAAARAKEIQRRAHRRSNSCPVPLNVRLRSGKTFADVNYMLLNRYTLYHAAATKLPKHHGPATPSDSNTNNTRHLRNDSFLYRIFHPYKRLESWMHSEAFLRLLLDDAELMEEVPLTLPLVWAVIQWNNHDESQMDDTSSDGGRDPWIDDGRVDKTWMEEQVDGEEDGFDERTTDEDSNATGTPSSTTKEKQRDDTQSTAHRPRARAHVRVRSFSTMVEPLTAMRTPNSGVTATPSASSTPPNPTPDSMTVNASVTPPTSSLSTSSASPDVGSSPPACPRTPYPSPASQVNPPQCSPSPACSSAAPSMSSSSPSPSTTPPAAPVVYGSRGNVLANPGQGMGGHARHSLPEQLAIGAHGYTSSKSSPTTPYMGASEGSHESPTPLHLSSSSSTPSGETQHHLDVPVRLHVCIQPMSPGSAFTNPSSSPMYPSQTPPTDSGPTSSARRQQPPSLPSTLPPPPPAEPRHQSSFVATTTFHHRSEAPLRHSYSSSDIPEGRTSMDGVDSRSVSYTDELEPGRYRGSRRESMVSVGSQAGAAGHSGAVSATGTRRNSLVSGNSSKRSSASETDSINSFHTPRQPSNESLPSHSPATVVSCSPSPSCPTLSTPPRQRTRARATIFQTAPSPLAMKRESTGPSQGSKPGYATMRVSPSMTRAPRDAATSQSSTSTAATTIPDRLPHWKVRSLVGCKHCYRSALKFQKEITQRYGIDAGMWDGSSDEDASSKNEEKGKKKKADTMRTLGSMEEKHGHQGLEMQRDANMKKPLPICRFSITLANNLLNLLLSPLYTQASLGTSGVHGGSMTSGHGQGCVGGGGGSLSGMTSRRRGSLLHPILADSFNVLGKSIIQPHMWPTILACLPSRKREQEIVRREVRCKVQINRLQERMRMEEHNYQVAQPLLATSPESMEADLEHSMFALQSSHAQVLHLKQHVLKDLTYLFIGGGGGGGASGSVAAAARNCRLLVNFFTMVARTEMKKIEGKREMLEQISKMHPSERSRAERRMRRKEDADPLNKLRIGPWQQQLIELIHPCADPATTAVVTDLNSQNATLAVQPILIAGSHLTVPSSLGSLLTSAGDVGLDRLQSRIAQYVLNVFGVMHFYKFQCIGSVTKGSNKASSNSKSSSKSSFTSTQGAVHTTSADFERMMKESMWFSIQMERAMRTNTPLIPDMNPKVEEKRTGTMKKDATSPTSPHHTIAGIRRGVMMDYCLARCMLTTMLQRLIAKIKSKTCNLEQRWVSPLQRCETLMILFTLMRLNEDAPIDSVC